MNFLSKAMPVSVPLLAVLASCLFSLVRILGNPLLNDDAFGYLRAAELFNTAGIGAVLNGYGWYAYSILIALGDRILPGGLLASAHVLNTASYALLVFVFIRLCTEACVSWEKRRDPQTLMRMQWFSALVILGFPLINEMRFFLIRDIAFWAFALLSLLHLLRFNRSGRLLDALCWSLALFAATVFRLEGLLIAVVAPFAILLDSTQGDTAQKLRRFGTLLGVLLALLLAVFVLGLAAGINLLELVQFAYRFYLPQLYDLRTILTTTATALNEVMFTPANFPGTDNIAHGLAIVLFAYLFTMLANLVEALSVPLTLFLGYAIWRGYVQLQAPMRFPLWAYLISSLAALLLFLFVMHFQTQRYATFVCILLLLPLPGALDTLYQRAVANHETRRFNAWLALFCVYFFTDSLVSFGHSKAYLEQAVTWTFSELPPDAQVHTNNYALAYYSGRIDDYDKIPLDPAEVFAQSASSDYLILDIKHDNAEVRSLLDADPRLLSLTSFVNTRGDEVRIYQRK